MDTWHIKNIKDKYEVPKEINATLREYQVEGFNFIKNLEVLKLGGILADEMGLGKTVIQLCQKDARMHFDMAQKNTIMWVTEDDIPLMLKNRIIATID